MTLAGTNQQGVAERDDTDSADIHQKNQDDFAADGDI